VLAETGHSYWAAAVALALVCAVGSVIVTVARHVGFGLRNERPRHGYLDAVRRLAALQTAVFLVQELLERRRGGAPVATMFQARFLAIGIAIQLLVAVGVALVLTIVAIAGEAIGRELARRAGCSRVASIALTLHDVRPHRDATSWADLARGPPAPSLLLV
jgi:hypothetical protein